MYCLRARVVVARDIGISKQIAACVRRLVEGCRAVVCGDARSRASVVTRTRKRQRRDDVAEKDAKILATTGPDPDLAAMAEHAAREGVFRIATERSRVRRHAGIAKGIYKDAELDRLRDDWKR
jgi:hypothetical protein